MSDLFTNQSNNSQIASNGGVPATSVGTNESSTRLLPRQVSTGTMRGTQAVGSGGTEIDSSNNRITLGNSIILDGNTEVITVTDTTGTIVGMGRIPGSTTDFGFFGTDAKGNLVFKYVNGTWYDYDPSTSINYMQHGILPDGSGGWAIAKQGTNVSSGF